MPRNLRKGEFEKQAKARRELALARGEFAYPSSPRLSAAGPTSFALKADDAGDRALIEEALAKRGTR